MLDLNESYTSTLSKYKFIDLFAGIGGFRLAFESFGAKCVFSSEWDKYAQETYYQNFKEIPHGDITKIKSEKIPYHDILCAGFPCQAFSISGKQRGFEDVRGTLFFEVARIAKHHQPKIMILENVKNFENHDCGKTIKTILETLDEIGYNVFYKVLNASLYGVPQNRERIYIICLRKDLQVNLLDFPKPLNSKITVKDISLPSEQTEKYVINRNDIKLNHLKIDQVNFAKCLSKPIRIGTVNKGGQGERIYHELGHAITLSAYGGGIGAKTGLYIIDNKIRKLSPRECARAMGFPDEYIINSRDTQTYKQFGNSVVINVLQAIIIKMIDSKVFADRGLICQAI